MPSRELDGAALMKFLCRSSLLPLIPSIHEGERRLSICSIPDKEIKSLLSKEKKLLELFTQVFAVRLHPCGGAVERVSPVI